MAFRTRQDGRVYNSKSYRTSGEIVSKEGKPVTKKSETKILKDELKKERDRLNDLRRKKVVEAKQRQKQQAIRETISRIKREQSLLNALNTNRISPERVDLIRHGSKDNMGSNFRTIPGLVG